MKGALGSTLDLSKRDLKAEYRHGLKVAKAVSTQDFAGTHKNTAGWFYEPTTRIIDTLQEILTSFNYVLNYTDLTELYKAKKEITSCFIQMKQYLNEDSDFAEGYFAPDEGYLSNRDHGNSELSSMKAYYVNRVIKLVLKFHNKKFISPST